MAVNTKNWQELKKPTSLELKDSGSDKKRKATFVAEPLERGFGLTLGNALRRVLLSRLQGAAITSIKIENVLHEFSSLAGVREDVTDIVLNVKQIALKMEGEGPKRLQLSATGPGAVKAGDSGSSFLKAGDSGRSCKAGDSGSSNVTPSYAITPFQGIQNAAGLFEHNRQLHRSEAEAPVFFGDQNRRPTLLVDHALPRIFIVRRRTLHNSSSARHTSQKTAYGCPQLFLFVGEPEIQRPILPDS